MRLFAFFGSLLVLALLAALIVPSYVDWNQFKTRFEQEATNVLGLPVEVRGQTSARLLPLPSVTFTDVRIAGDATDSALLEADSFKLDVELAPLLKGDVVIVDMQLNAPKLSVVLDKAGRIKLPPKKESNVPIEAAGVTFENIGINGGTVQLNDLRNGRVLAFSDLNFNASAAELYGPWRGQGQGQFDGEAFQFSASTGRWQNSRSIGLKLDVAPQSLPYDFRYDGLVSFANSLLTTKGLLRVSPMAKQSDQDLISFRRPGRDTALPIWLESDLEIASGGATVPAFKLDIGDRDDPYTLTGNGQALFGKQVSFRLRAEGQQVDVKRFSSAGDQNSTGQSLRERLAGLQNLIRQIPRFSVDGEVSLFLPAVVAGDTVVREVGMDLRPTPEGQGWEINNLEAQLPGRTDLRADGKLTVGESLGYEGDLIVASRQPSGLAKWLGSSGDPAIRDLANAGFSAKATITESDLIFDDVEIILDGNTLKGSVRRESRGDERPLIAATLVGKEVNFDQLNGLLGLFYGGDGQSVVNAHDLNLDLKSDRVLTSGFDAEDVTAQLAIVENGLLVQNLNIGQLAGATLNVEGDVRRDANRESGELKASVKADNLAPLLSLLNNRFGPFPLLADLADRRDGLSGTDINLTLSRTENGYAVRSSGVAGGSDISMQLDATRAKDQKGLFSKDQNLSLKTVIVNNNTSDLLYQLGIPAVDIDQSGRGALRLSAVGSVNQGFDTNAALTLQDGYASIEGLLKPVIDGTALSLSGSVSAKSEFRDGDSFILLSGLPLPGLGSGLDGDAEAKIELEPGKVTLRDLKGRIGESGFTGTLSLDRSVKPRAFLAGGLAFSRIDTKSLSGLVFTGEKPVLSGLDGAIEITADEVVFPHDQPPAKMFKSKLSIRDGDMGFENFTATLLGGVSKGNVYLAQNSGNASLNGQLVLNGARVETMLERLRIEPSLKGLTNLAATFETAGTDETSMIKGLTASGTMRLEQGQLSGLNADAFSGVLKKADALEDADVPTQANALLNAELLKGAISFEPVDVPFSISGGLVRVDNIELKNDAVALTASGRFDLANGNLDVTTRGAFDAGREVVLGAKPEFNFNLTRQDGTIKKTVQADLFAAYLGMWVAERREREFESQRSAILERQRLQQSARLYALREDAKRIAAEERGRIRKLEAEQEAKRKRDEARRRREEIERKRLEAELLEAEKRAAREAALEAGRRAKRQEQIDLLRKQAEEARKRLELDENITVDEDSFKLEN